MEHPYLVQGRVIITDKNKAAAIHNKGNFGYFQDGRLELSLEEALYLKEKKTHRHLRRKREGTEFHRFRKIRSKETEKVLDKVLRVQGYEVPGVHTEDSL